MWGNPVVLHEEVFEGVGEHHDDGGTTVDEPLDGMLGPLHERRCPLNPALFCPGTMEVDDAMRPPRSHHHRDRSVEREVDVEDGSCPQRTRPSRHPPDSSEYRRRRRRAARRTDFEAGDRNAVTTQPSNVVLDVSIETPGAHRTRLETNHHHLFHDRGPSPAAW